VELDAVAIVGGGSSQTGIWGEGCVRVVLARALVCLVWARRLGRTGKPPTIGAGQARLGSARALQSQPDKSVQTCAAHPLQLCVIPAFLGQ
jgi:hypothetical protein